MGYGNSKVSAAKHYQRKDGKDRVAVTTVNTNTNTNTKTADQQKVTTTLEAGESKGLENEETTKNRSHSRKKQANNRQSRSPGKRNTVNNHFSPKTRSLVYSVNTYPFFFLCLFYFFYFFFFCDVCEDV